jgi:tetratricopeptide (TPR) repeat protein
MRRDLPDDAVEVFVNTYSRFENSMWSAMSIYQHAELLRKAGRFAEARTKYEEFTARAEEMQGLTLLVCRSRLSIGVCIFNAGNIEEALKAFQQLSRTSRDLRTAHEASFQAARCLFLLGREPEGIKTLRLLVSAGEETGFSPLAQLELANHFLSAGKHAEAQAEFEKLVADFPLSPQAEAGMYDLAVLALKRNDPAAARKWTSRLLKERPASDFAPSAEVLEAGTLVAEGRTDEALAEYARLREKYAGKSIEHLVTVENGELLLKLEKFEDALALFLKARISKVDEWAARSVYGAATCLRKLARSSEALEEYLTLITTWLGDERRDMAVLEAADIYTELGKYAEAIRLLELHSEPGRAQDRIKRIREMMKEQ